MRLEIWSSRLRFLASMPINTRPYAHMVLMVPTWKYEEAKRISASFPFFHYMVLPPQQKFLRAPVFVSIKILRFKRQLLTLTFWVNEQICEISQSKRVRLTAIVCSVRWSDRWGWTAVSWINLVLISTSRSNFELATILLNNSAVDETESKWVGDWAYRASNGLETG